MSAGRAAVPEGMKREVRTRCSFGCVFCGIPIVEYDHMTEWSVVRAHVAENITLLCPTHHSEKDRNLLTEAQVRGADANPYNRARGATGPYGLNLKGLGQPKVTIGGNLFTYPGDNFVAVMVDNEPVVSWHRDLDGALMLQLDLRDANDHTVLRVIDNELVVTTAAWDLQFESNRLTIRSGAGEIVLMIAFEPPDAITFLRTRILFHGMQLDADEKCLWTADGVNFGSNYVMQPVGLFCQSKPVPAVCLPSVGWRKLRGVGQNPTT